MYISKNDVYKHLLYAHHTSCVYMYTDHRHMPLLESRA